MVFSVKNKVDAFGIRGLKMLMSSLTAAINCDVKQRTELAVCHIRVINTYVDDYG
jgi:hypothetical protein